MYGSVPCTHLLCVSATLCHRPAWFTPSVVCDLACQCCSVGSVLGFPSALSPDWEHTRTDIQCQITASFSWALLESYFWILSSTKLILDPCLFLDSDSCLVLRKLLPICQSVANLFLCYHVSQAKSLLYRCLYFCLPVYQPLCLFLTEPYLYLYCDLLIFEFPFWLFCCQLGVLPDCFKRIKEHLNCPAAPESAFEFTIFTWPHRPWHVVLHFF